MMVSGRSTLPNLRSTFSPSELHTILVYSNHLRYQSRHNLFIECVEHLLNTGVTLYVVELSHGDRQPVLKLPPEVQHIKLRCRDVMWHKECMINVGMKAAIENGAQYLAWVDGDIQFANPHWATETIEALQSRVVVQPWQYSFDLDQKHNATPDQNGNIGSESFCALWVKQIRSGYGYGLTSNNISDSADYQSVVGKRKIGHTGYAWAMRADAYKSIKTLPDWPIIGSSDTIIAFGFAGLLTQFLKKGGYWWTTKESYRSRIKDFQNLCTDFINTNIGFVPGTILHGWHGPKSKRGYISRAQVLKDSDFDPDLDLVMNINGLYRFGRNNPALRDGLLNYFESRDEDQPA